MIKYILEIKDAFSAVQINLKQPVTKQIAVENCFRKNVHKFTAVNTLIISFLFLFTNVMHIIELQIVKIIQLQAEIYTILFKGKF